MRSKWVALVLGLTLIAATGTTSAASEARAAAGGLEFQGNLFLSSSSVACPANVPPNTTECRAHHGGGSLSFSSVPRWWPLSEAIYTLPFGIGPPTCPAGLGKPLGATGRLFVAGKGEVSFTLAEGARCVSVEPTWDEMQEITMTSQEFTITGGTGAFAGASGSGKVERWGYFGEETWKGTLTAPGLHFTLPELTGAVAKTVRAAKGAKSARVSFEVTATDDGGGAIPVSCHPSSGSRFPLGETLVLCTATDPSGNTATAGFTVTVKRGRG